MNEVSSIPNASPIAAGNGSTTGTVAARSDGSGNVLPTQTAPSEDQQVSPTPVDLENELQSVNDFVQSVQRDLEFSLDEESNTTVIRVIDSVSGNEIRQIPEDIFLVLARRLNEDGEFNLISALG